jgi:hypothetical protein
MIYEAVGKGDGSKTKRIRSSMAPSFGLGVDIRKEGNDYDLLRRTAEEWRRIAGYFLGDYYSLLSYTMDNSLWIY